jgi:ribosome-associated protein
MTNKPQINDPDRSMQISRTKKKKEALALQDLGERLVRLSDEQIEDIDLPGDILDAVKFAKTIRSHGALRRQMQYIGTLMRRIDPAPVHEAINSIEQGYYKRTAAFRELESWRDELIAGNEKMLDEIIDTYPDADRKLLTQLITKARKEKAENNPPKASRALFRMLRQIRAESPP